MGTFDKAKDALKSELITDAVLDKAAAAAKSKLGQDKASQIDMARDFIDKKVGSAGRFAFGYSPKSSGCSCVWSSCECSAWRNSWSWSWLLGSVPAACV